jgi:hypothetical protein
MSCQGVHVCHREACIVPLGGVRGWHNWEDIDVVDVQYASYINPAVSVSTINDRALECTVQRGCALRCMYLLHTMGSLRSWPHVMMRSTARSDLHTGVLTTGRLILMARGGAMRTQQPRAALRKCQFAQVHQCTCGGIVVLHLGTHHNFSSVTISREDHLVWKTSTATQSGQTRKGDLERLDDAQLGCPDSLRTRHKGGGSFTGVVCMMYLHMYLRAHSDFVQQGAGNAAL